MLIRQKILHVANSVLNMAGRECEVYRCEKYSPQETDKKKINIGAGKWKCPGWINLDYPSEWYAKSQKENLFVPYDIRNDKLPFEDGTVSDIYSSHVIEHIENSYIAVLFRECYRVMCKGGVLRIVCPDAEFHYQTLKYAKREYWEWLRRAFEMAGADYDKMRPLDCLIRQVATPLLSRNNYSLGTKYEKEFEEMEMYEFFDLLTGNLKFNPEYVFEHINYWTYEKAKKMLNDVGFQIVMRSKYLGSISCNMQDRRYFDRTQPKISLYIEAVK